MESIERLVERFKVQDLSGEDIQRLVGKYPVVYSELAQYRSVKDLLGKEKYAVILYEVSSKTSGHFVALYEREDGTLCFADSYGLFVDDEDQYAPTNAKLPKYLGALIAKSGMPFEYNRIDYQSRKSGVATCGRWSCFFCLFGRKRTFAQIDALLTRNASAWLNQPDNIVVMLSLWPLLEL